ncbi:hypothetical protein MVEN_01122900 [Mycena venus]|uniref:Uncharacterized protein n=1 Tax=Mycena venus TaxID=2733690 RepID=A0A8H6Y8H0_9AGAR|nr:hypothetical protein MVEN_01122900 [Mycena venus]
MWTQILTTPWVNGALFRGQIEDQFLQKPRHALPLALLSSAFFSHVNGELLLTNAERLRRGLPPAPPKRTYDPTRVRRNAPAAPSPTLCSEIGSKNMAIELIKDSDKSFLGYVGEGSTNTYNVVYDGFGSTKGPNLGLLFNVVSGYPYSAITVVANNKNSFCAEVNQYNQDLYNVDSSYRSEPKNYLYNVDCSNPGGYVQRRNYDWDSNGVISLEWLEPPNSGHGYDVYPVLWYRQNSSPNVFRWYPPGVTPTYSGRNPWVQAHLRWSCVNP